MPMGFNWGPRRAVFIAQDLGSRYVDELSLNNYAEMPVGVVYRSKIVKII